MATTVERLTVQSLAVTDLIPTPDNPRRIDEKDAEFQKLLESVKSAGVLIPVHVRPHPDREGKWDLRCGERRWRAARLARRPVIPAIVHEGMSDEEALHLTVVENLERDGLGPTEEGRAVALMLERHGGDRKAVAAVLGRSERWVAVRARLAVLSENWQAALADEGSEVFGWGVGMLEVIARFEPEQQDAILADIIRGELYVEHMSVRSLEQAIDREYLLQLASARWPMDDAELVPEAGACSSCPKRSGAQGLLWHEELDAEKLAKEDRCLDRACWERKELAFADRRIEATRAKHPAAVLVLGEEAGYQERERLEEHLQTKLARKRDFQPAKKGEKGAVPAVIVSGKSLGRVAWLKPYSSAGRSSASKASGPKILAEKREALQQRRNGLVCGWVAEEIQKADIPRLQEVVALIAAFGAQHPHLTCDEDAEAEADRWDIFDRASREGDDPLTARLWSRVEPLLIKAVHPLSYEKTFDDRMIDAERLCGLLGIDLAALQARAEAEKPEPKSWAKQEVHDEGTKGTNRKQSEKRV